MITENKTRGIKINIIILSLFLLIGIIVVHDVKGFTEKDRTNEEITLQTSQTALVNLDIEMSQSSGVRLGISGEKPEEMIRVEVTVRDAVSREPIENAKVFGVWTGRYLGRSLDGPTPFAGVYTFETYLNPVRNDTDKVAFNVTKVIDITDGQEYELAGTTTASIVIPPTEFGNPSVHAPPLADAGGPYYGTVGKVITFDASASHDPDNDELTYRWDFGEGPKVITSSPTKTHTYSKSGIYNVTLVVQDTDGFEAIDITTAEITLPTSPTAFVNIELSKQSVYNWWRRNDEILTAEVTIRDVASQEPIRNARVYGVWTGSYIDKDSVSDLSDSDGTVTFVTPVDPARTNPDYITFSITKVVKDSEEYELTGTTTSYLVLGPREVERSVKRPFVSWIANLMK